MNAILSNVSLIRKLARREFDQRFRGSLLGWFWALIAPLAMLAVFSLVFGSIFGARWARPDSAATQTEFGFPLLLFSGLIVFNFFGETFNRAPGLILENTSYVKKVVFPLEILPVVTLLSSLTTAAISFVAFMVVYVVLHGLPPLTIVLLPLVLLPLALITLGICYFFASLGVFLRDLRHVTPPLSTAMLFLSSVFYDPQTVPESYRWMLYLNPLTPAVNHVRDVLFWGRIPDPLEFAIFLTTATVVFLLGLEWFKRTEKAFADVV